MTPLDDPAFPILPSTTEPDALIGGGAEDRRANARIHGKDTSTGTFIPAPPTDQGRWKTVEVSLINPQDIISTE